MRQAQASRDPEGPCRRTGPHRSPLPRKVMRRVASLVGRRRSVALVIAAEIACWAMPDTTASVTPSTLILATAAGFAPFGPHLRIGVEIVWIQWTITTRQTGNDLCRHDGAHILPEGCRSRGLWTCRLNRKSSDPISQESARCEAQKSSMLSLATPRAK